MKDEERLAEAGSAEEQRLLRSAGAIRVPAQIQEQVRLQVDARIAGRTPANRKTWRLVFVVAGVVLAGTAAAQSRNALARVWDAITGNGGAKRAPSMPAVRAPAGTTIQPLPGAAPVAKPEAPAEVGPRRATDLHASPPPPAGVTAPPVQPGINPPTLRPDLNLNALLHARPDDPTGVSPAGTPPAAAVVSAGRLFMARAGRGDITLTMAGDTIRGSVRGRSLGLTVSPTTITGRIGEDELRINMRGTRRADGAVGGRELGFTFNPTEHGWIVGASLPALAGRVALDTARLSFFPGCDNDLPTVAAHPGRYEGTCSDSTLARIDLPPAFWNLPDQVRMIVLGLLLPEPEPAERDLHPGLFPSP